MKYKIIKFNEAVFDDEDKVLYETANRCVKVYTDGFGTVRMDISMPGASVTARLKDISYYVDERCILIGGTDTVVSVRDCRILSFFTKLLTKMGLLNYET